MQIDINTRKQLNKPENYAAFYGLLNRLPTSDRDALKESIVSQYTEGRTTSLRDMTLKEYSAAVSAMRKLVPATYREELRKILRQKRSQSCTSYNFWESIRPTGTVSMPIAVTGVLPAWSFGSLTVRVWIPCW